MVYPQFVRRRLAPRTQRWFEMAAVAGLAFSIGLAVHPNGRRERPPTAAQSHSVAPAVGPAARQDDGLARISASELRALAIYRQSERDYSSPATGSTRSTRVVEAERSALALYRQGELTTRASTATMKLRRAMALYREDELQARADS